MGRRKKQLSKSPQRQARRERRQERRAAAREFEFSPDLVREAALQFSGDDRLASTPRAMSDAFRQSVLDSADLADEPELRDVLIDPMRCVDTYAKLVDQGVSLTEDPGDPWPVVLQVGREILSRENLNEIDERLTQLQERWKQTGESRGASRAALLRLALKQSPEACAGIGLVLAIVMRSVRAGRQLSEQLLPLARAAQSGDPAVPLADRIAGVLEPGAADRMMDEFPGLEAHLSKELNKQLDAALDLVSRDRVFIGLFDIDELTQTFRSLVQAVGRDPDGEASPPAQPRTPTKEAMKAWKAALLRRVAEVLTPERTLVACNRLKQAIQAPEYREVTPLLVHLLNRLQQPELDESTAGMLATVMLSELKIVSNEVRRRKEA